mgnify:CR=1 FL=1
MILAASAIAAGVREGTIVVDPFDLRFLGPNSYDLHLGSRMVRLAAPLVDPLTPTAYEECPFRETYTVFPGELYLAHTVERAGSAVYVPKIEGKSTLARLGLSIHVTAGYGDVGFVGSWTLEITTVRPFVLHAGMPICQIEFSTLLRKEGEEDRLYVGTYNGLEDIGLPRPRGDWIFLGDPRSGEGGSEGA